MKKIIISIISLTILNGCISDESKSQPYRYAVGNYIPDSNRAEMAKFIKETVSAASYHMNGGDYEDPEDVILQAEETARRIFSVKTGGLEHSKCDQCYWEFIPESKLDSVQMKIYHDLR